MFLLSSCRKLIPTEFWKNYKLEENILNEKRKTYLAYHRNLMTEIDARA